MDKIEITIELYKTMSLIRKTEQAIQREYPKDEMKTPVHSSLGEEAITAGVCLALGKGTQFFGTYRNHALYLSATGETDKFFAELYGKASGVAGGKAGSMHLTFPENGLVLTSAVVGTTIPVAVGAAFANRYLGKKTRTAVFFGDGAVDEGVFWESLNFACLWRIPVIFIYEDNGLAIHTPASARHGYKSLTNIARQFNCLAGKINSTDAFLIYNRACNLVDEMDKIGSPLFLSCKYYRYLEHVGIKEDFDAGYRSRDEFLEWRKRDPIDIQRKKLIKLGQQGAVDEIDRKIDEQIARSIAAAKSADFLSVESLTEGVYT